MTPTVAGNFSPLPKLSSTNNSSIQKDTVQSVTQFNSIQKRRSKRNKQMRGWNQLGAVDTIYEEECEFSSSSSSSPSPASLRSRVEAWSLKTGRVTDILIRVQGICFRLHKDRVVSQSSYLKRHLTATSDLTVSPPLNITAETFAAVVEFCYSGKVQMTPTNVAAVRTAAELLGMTEGGESLRHVVETYLRGVIGVNEEYASMILRSCLSLLPEAETTAFLVTRCIEALVSGHGNACGVSGLNDVTEMQPQDFQTVVESMSRRFESHDVLYKMVDLYLKENNLDKLTEEQRSQVCNSIDCNKLSTSTLVDCVQNPRMPLRFVVRAVLVEHLNTRHSITIAGAQQYNHLQFESNRRERGRRRSMTLGDFLRRDAALHQTAQLKAAMDSTSARIQSLEEELRCMNKVLLERGEGEERKVLEAERSASFHFVTTSEKGRIERGERLSVSSSRIRFDDAILMEHFVTTSEKGRIERGERLSVSSSRIRFDDAILMEKHQLERSSFSVDVGSVSPKIRKSSLRQRLMTGLKYAFRVPNSASS